MVNVPATRDELYNTLRRGYKIIALIDPNGGPEGHFVVIEGIGPNGGIIIGDPSEGRTSLIPDVNLYMSRWIASIVVGR